MMENYRLLLKYWQEDGVEDYHLIYGDNQTLSDVCSYMWKGLKILMEFMLREAMKTQNSMKRKLLKWLVTVTNQ